MTAGSRYDTSPIGTGKNWVTKTDPKEGLGPFVRAVVHAIMRTQGMGESQAIEIALGVIKRWAAGDSNHWHGAKHVTAKTQAKAKAAVAHWDELKAEAKGNRFEGEGGSGGDLLPVGPSPKVAKAVVETEEHAFRGSDVQACSKCGQPATAPIHRATRKPRTTPQQRFAQNVMDELHGQRAEPNPIRRQRALKARFLADGAELEGEFRSTMTDLFDKQKAATLSRLRGTRGRRMLRGLRANPPNGQQPPPPAATVPGAVPPAIPAVPLPTVPTSAPPIDVADIFDIQHWKQKTAEATQPIYDKAAQLGAEHVRRQLPAAIQSGTVAPGSLASVTDIMANRAIKMAREVTTTTSDAIKTQLAEGLQLAEDINQLAARVEAVFAEADTTRAQTIARTEAHSAMNAAAYTYAHKLPVGTRSWLCHHDGRTRPTHLVAGSTQIKVPMGEPYIVGGAPMMYPGDPAAPPDEVVNCRCAQAFYPAEKSRPVAETPMLDPTEVAA